MDNPYQANAAFTYSRRDAKFFRMALNLYKKYRDRDMPLLELMGIYLGNWLVSGIFMLVPVTLLIWSFPQGRSLAAAFTFILGMYVGRILRDIHHCRVSSRLWPVIREVLQWDRIDAKLDELSSL